MSRASAASLRLCLALVFPLLAVGVGHGEDAWESVARVVAVGDVHGDYEQFVTVLSDAGLVDAKLRWTGGKTHLVQTGDRLDRGARSRKVMDLLMRLEKDAGKAGGMVHPLLGNHEAMNMLGDLRYVTPEEFAAFKGTDSQRYRDALWEQRREERKRRGESELTSEDRKRFDAEIPLGYVEHRLAFAPEGDLWGVARPPERRHPHRRHALPARRNLAEVRRLFPHRPERARSAASSRTPTP